MVDGGAEVRGVEVGCCVDGADVVEGGVEVGDEEGMVTVGKDGEKVDARFFKHFALEGLENWSRRDRDGRQEGPRCRYKDLGSFSQGGCGWTAR